MRDLGALFDLHGRVAIVTGGAGHIGSAIADALAELGASIAIVDLERKSIEDVCSRIGNDRKVEMLAIPVNLEDEMALRTIPSVTIQMFGQIDILVNCAALVGTSGLDGWAVPLQDQSATSWRRALEVNLTAPFILAQLSADALAKSGNGSIVNVLSIYGLVGPDERIYEGTPMGNPAAYGSSKAGLLQLTRHLATTLAPSVRCNAITPGGVERGQAEPFIERYVARTPLKRMAIEEDFKGAAAFLASDASAYVTGQNIVVDGGWTAW
jgi:NAD(P)-dependent dehydrogenase (short-subunit alcohol dehydrogenase family)